mmetsp:Transcript_11319/g.38584  ORF Transcript_11319/g.38584 Transcript_11319/m.38584 type:complete len:171 (-) Transcript_11319:158-670(-)
MRARPPCPAGAQFSMLLEGPDGEVIQKPTYFFVSPGLDVLQWSNEEPDASDRPATAGGVGWRGSRLGGGSQGGSTPTASIRSVQRGGWRVVSGRSPAHSLSRGTPDPYSTKNCAWQFATDAVEVSLLAQDNAQREDWVTALTLISKAAARGMLPGNLTRGIGSSESFLRI